MSEGSINASASHGIPMDVGAPSSERLPPVSRYPPPDGLSREERRATHSGGWEATLSGEEMLERARMDLDEPENIFEGMEDAPGCPPPLPGGAWGSLTFATPENPTGKPTLDGLFPPSLWYRQNYRRLQREYRQQLLYEADQARRGHPGPASGYGAAPLMSSAADPGISSPIFLP